MFDNILTATDCFCSLGYFGSTSLLYFINLLYKFRLLLICRIDTNLNYQQTAQREASIFRIACRFEVPAQSVLGDTF